jgi:hypothetical protein
MEEEEESSKQAKQVWLGKLGCMLKLHANIEGQWVYTSMEPNINLSLHPDPFMFSNPWAYTIPEFPKNYKLFAVERATEGGDLPRKDHYLCGIVLFFLSSVYYLTNHSFQVGLKTIDHHRNSIHTCTGYSTVLRGSRNHASANTVILAEHKNKSMKFSHSPHTSKVPKGPPEHPRNPNKQRNCRSLGVSQSQGR